MAFSINTNIASLQAQEYLRVTNDFQGKTLNRVTSGLRIISSGDDAAGLAIANSYRSDQAVLSQGIRNANDGLSTLQTIDGGINNISKLLDRARTLATQSASGTFEGDRNFLDKEFQSVISEIDRQAQSIGLTQGGKFAKALSVFVGGGRDASVNGNQANAAAVTNGSVTVDLSNSAVDSKSLGLSTYQVTRGATGTIDLATITGNTAASGRIDFTFFGAGFESGVTVQAMNNDTAKSIDDVVANINAAIGVQGAQAGTAAAAFKAAGIVATKGSDGTIQFSSATSAFSVSDGSNGATAAQNILGVGAGVDRVSSGGNKATLYYATDLDQNETQTLTFSMVDSSGQLISKQVNLEDTVDAMTKAEAITAINTALKASNNELSKLVAVDADASATGEITILGGNSSFKIYVAASGGGAAADEGITTEAASGQNAFVDSEADAAGAVGISTQDGAKLAVSALATAVSNLGAAQAAVGKGQNQFTYAVNLAQSQLGNMAAAESRIRDADLANEAANMTKAQILLQAGVAALAQANSAPQQILSLLRG